MQLAKAVMVTLALGACGRPRLGAALPPCHEQAAAALDTTRWRTNDGRGFPSLALPPEFALDRGLASPVCLHGGIMWRDTTAADESSASRFVGWCISDGMPRVDSPDNALRRLPPPGLPTKSSEPGEALCALGFPVLGQRMALWRIAEDSSLTMWRWYMLPLEHGEPLYLLARSPSKGDEAVVVRALPDMRWVR